MSLDYGNHQNRALWSSKCSWIKFKKMSSLGKCIHHQKASPVIEEKSKTALKPVLSQQEDPMCLQRVDTSLLVTRSLLVVSVTVFRFLQQGALFPFISWHLFFVWGVIISSSKKTELILFLWWELPLLYLFLVHPGYALPCLFYLMQRCTAN